MEQVKKHRSVLRASFTKKVNETDSLLGEENGDIMKINVNMRMLESKLEELITTDNNIFESLLSDQNVTEEQLSEEIEGRDSYRQRFIELQSKLNSKKIETAVETIPNRSATTTVDQGMKRKFKLPTIEFKKFGGDIKDWLPFWAQFKKIHDDKTIDLTDKIIYLSQATIPGSRAQQIVESFPAIPENYENIVDSLKSRFGREDLQIEVYVREILKLVLNKSNKNCNVSVLYDKIETQLRSLETLGITSDKYAAMLYPLIESCLPENLIRTYQRSLSNCYNVTVAFNTEVHDSLEKRLKGLMQFLRGEVENEQRISLAAESFGFGDRITRNDKGRSDKVSTYTVAELINCDNKKCIFCEGNHDCKNCFKAQKMTIDQKRDELSKNKACFRCLKRGHSSKKCYSKLKCLVCGNNHVAIMCPNLPSHKIQKSRTSNKESESISQVLSNQNFAEVYMQTLRVKLVGNISEKYIRVLIDTGSQRSYITKDAAQEMGFEPIRVEKIVHALFGDRNTEEQLHNCYKIELSKGEYACSLEVLDQPLICSAVPHILNGPWLEELKDLNIFISDVVDDGPIEVLIGSDVAGKLLTGRKMMLKCGLVAVETFLGWTLMGRVPQANQSFCNLAITTTNLLVKNAAITDLWELESLGITDPYEKKSRQEKELEAKNMFLETILINEEGRYEVRLPWKDNYPILPENYSIAEKRLNITVKKLKDGNLFDVYENIFKEWCTDGIIEEVPDNEIKNKGHYLPHRPVIKENSATTKIRPVFDASAREKDKPSLNDCLEKGPNLIELIPSILLRFRENKIGVISDIKKAFLQISIQPSDRDFLRFIWVDTNNCVKIYRHRRVVFGVNCSPFLLGGTIEYHLANILHKCELGDSSYSQSNILRLSKSFYVDNCVTSVSDDFTLKAFIKDSCMIMEECKFELRGWEHTKQHLSPSATNNIVSLLGLSWDTQKDVLFLSNNNHSDFDEISTDKPITKRIMLSLAQRVFDPIGFTCPVTLIPKLLLQQTWKLKLSWDSSIDGILEKKFRKWLKEIPYLFKIEIPRWIYAGPNDARCLSMHTFCDASKDAYAAVVFLRGFRDGAVFVRLLAAKARVAPIRDITIPRLELLAAVIGTRLFVSTKEELKIDIVSYFWSDSATVLTWIRKAEEWGAFVNNRVKEIRKSSSSDQWCYVPGKLNPADLPSRGSSAKELLQSKWWEGPSWLLEESHVWPDQNFQCNNGEIDKERKKCVTTLANVTISKIVEDFHLNYFSKFLKTVRMIAWMFRFINNIRKKKRSAELTLEEIDEAEKYLFKLVQKEVFGDESNNQLASLNPFKDSFGIIRTTSKVSNRIDTDNFRFPIILPGRHPIINKLIFDVHIKSCHVGVQGLMSILREKYWILGGRRVIKSAIYKCVVCKRQKSRSLNIGSPPLPLDRVRDANVFEVSGVDFVGPVYLRNSGKAWICLFTCAIYRAVHLELCGCLSVDSFMQALRRFISRRGRPKTLFSDNGTNFVGTENAFRKLDWEKIVTNSVIERITWRFSPPTAPWWGGFWERLVGLLKQLLRKVLARASVDYENMITILCDCESVINSRPLTYISNDSHELVPLTPAMFLKEQTESGVPDCDAVDDQSLSKKIRHRQKLKKDLRQRFRNEYLGQLKILQKKSSSRQISVDDVVLIGNDSTKRIDWPLGRVVELITGKDGKIRLVKVRTERGHLLRPIQRIYPLECSRSVIHSDNNDDNDVRFNEGDEEQSRTEIHK